jgi:hypothetical protein
MKKWGIHFDHPWSEDVKKYGCPIRIYITTPWNVWTVGEKAQIFDRKTNTWTDRWAFIRSVPNDYLERTKNARKEKACPIRRF